MGSCWGKDGQMLRIPAGLAICLAALVTVGCGTANAPHPGSGANPAVSARAKSQGPPPGVSTAGPDGALLRCLARGEFLLNGFRNRDLRQLLCPATSDARQQRQQAAAMTRKLTLLRSHGLIVKIQRTHRYRLSAEGQRVTTALLAAYEADVNRLADAG